MNGKINFYNFKDIKKINFNDFQIILYQTSLNICEIIDSEYLYKTIIYGVDTFIDNIKGLNNKFKSIITQSQKLKDFFIKNGIEEKKLLLKNHFLKNTILNCQKEMIMK